MTVQVPHDLELLAGRTVARAWQRFFDALAAGLNTASGLILTAVQNTRLVNAGAGLIGGGDLSDDRYIGLYVFTGAVVDLPTTGLTPGEWAYAGDARNGGEGAGAGTGCAVQWSGSLWRIPGVATAVTS